MAIAFDAATLGTATSSGGSSTTVTHPCTGADRFLAGQLVTYNFSTGTPSPTATYNGIPLTANAVNVVAYNINNWRSHQLYLKNPSSGSNSLIFIVSSGTGILRGLAVSYTGVDQTSPVITSGTAASTSGNTMQVSLTTAQDAWWFIGGSNVDGGWTAGANTATIRESTGNIGAADSGADIAATTGNAQMSHGGTRGYGGIAMAFIAAGSSGYAGDIKSVAGVLQADIKSIAGVTNANIKSIAGVSNV